MTETNRICLTLNDEYLKRLDIIAKREYSDRSKLLRKWIDENFINPEENKEV